MAWPLAIQQNADDKQCWFTPCCDMRALAAAIHILQLWRRNVTRPAALTSFTVGFRLLVASKKECISRKGSIHSTPPHLTARPRPRVKRPKEPWPRLQAFKTRQNLHSSRTLAKAYNTLKPLRYTLYLIPYTSAGRGAESSGSTFASALK